MQKEEEIFGGGGMTPYLRIPLEKNGQFLETVRQTFRRESLEKMKKSLVDSTEAPTFAIRFEKNEQFLENIASNFLKTNLLEK